VCKVTTETIEKQRIRQKIDPQNPIMRLLLLQPNVSICRLGLLLLLSHSFFYSLSAFTPIYSHHAARRTRTIPVPISHQQMMVILYQSSPVTPAQSPATDNSSSSSSSNSNSENDREPSTPPPTSPPRRVYTTSSAAAAAAGRRVGPNVGPSPAGTFGGRGGGGGGGGSRNPRSFSTNTDRGPSTRPSQRPDYTTPQQQRGGFSSGASNHVNGRFNPSSSGDAGGLPTLKLVNPLRIARTVQQTPGTTEEIYSVERSGGGGRRDDGGNSGSSRGGGGGRGSKPNASAGGISTYQIYILGGYVPRNTHTRCWIHFPNHFVHIFHCCCFFSP
jgi:hypothetical protein